MVFRKAILAMFAGYAISVAGAATVSAQEVTCNTTDEDVCRSRWLSGCGWADPPGKCQRSGPTEMPIIKLSNQGWEVRSLQQLLKDKGFAVNVDGDFGTETKKAVKAFQQQKGLAKVDGVVGPDTYKLLSSE